MTELRHRYISVMPEEGGCSYGGDQNWFDGTMQKYGCGVIAASDTVRYLAAAEKPENRVFPVRSDYGKYIRSVRRDFVVFPFGGMLGPMLAAGLRKGLRREGIGHRFHVHWGVKPEHLVRYIRQMLADDIPVPFGAGPGFLMPPGDRKGLKLYVLGADGNYALSCIVKKHFMVMTGIDEEYIRISSWGREYYISIKEYEEYVRHDVYGTFSNICYIRRRRK